MAGQTYTVEGLDNLVRTLGRAGHDLDDLKDANRRAGEIVAREGSARAPRRSGKLAASVRPARQARRARVSAGGARVPYAGPIHWGWQARHIAPDPFIAWGAQATEPQWQQAYRADVQRALDRVRGA
jgi:hypothetical protein